MPRLKRKTAKKTKPDETREMVALGTGPRGFFLLARKTVGDAQELVKIASKNGKDFSGRETSVSIKKGRKQESIGECGDFRIASFGKEFTLTYFRTFRGKRTFVSAVSSDAKTWKIVSESKMIATPGIFVPSSEKKFVGDALYGDEKVLVSKIGKTKIFGIEIPRIPAWNFFDGTRFSIIGSLVSQEGLFVFFGARTGGSIVHNSDGTSAGTSSFKIGAVLFDGNDHGRLLWHGNFPMAEFLTGTDELFSLIGVSKVMLKKKEFVRFYGAYESSGKASLKYIDMAVGDLRNTHIEGRKLSATRVPENPIIEPGRQSWESEGTFNPTAVVLDDAVHLLYRAIGDDGLSRLGYAQSVDGVNFGAFLPRPAFTLQSSSKNGIKSQYQKFDPVLFPSGGSWGGCEDPRITRIGDTLYMTFNVFDGWDFIRIGVSSISADDFKRQHWRWSDPAIISPPGQIHKNWVLFPEKIGGAFAILHSISPKVEIAYRKDLKEIGKKEPAIESPHGPRTAGRRGFWDSRVRGAGGAPIKTSAGWLVFYHATDDYDPNKYKIGAMLLDLHQPEKVIGRSASPIISPDESYENIGKPGIVYTCGAIERDGNVYIYYGGGDRVACVAIVPLVPLVEYLLSSNRQQTIPKMARIPLSYVRR